MFPNYVCEFCQVRASTGRDLQYRKADLGLMMLERMRTLDTMHMWSAGTLKQYSGMYRRIRRFELKHGVQILRPSVLKTPPMSPAIPMAWAQLDYSTQPGKHDKDGTTYGTSRQLRSAASLFYTWDSLMTKSGRVFRDSERREIIQDFVSPTDEITSTLQNAGMARRMGTDSKPSWALSHKHVKFIDDQLKLAWDTAPDDGTRHEIAAAGAINMTKWTTWLRSGEAMSVRRDEVESCHPRDGADHGLPTGIGFIGMRLNPETKGSPHKTADVIGSYNSASGFSLGLWIDRLLTFEPSDGVHLFSTPNKRLWDGRYFRENYTWPFLEVMRISGEPSLKAFSNEPGKRICDKVYSGHSWRRGAQTFSRKSRPGLTTRGATKDERYIHARWSRGRTRASETIEWVYTDPPLEDRIAITLFCH